MLLSITGCGSQKEENNNNSNKIEEEQKKDINQDELEVTNSISCSDDVSDMKSYESIDSEYLFNNDTLIKIITSYVYNVNEEGAEEYNKSSRAVSVCNSFKTNGGNYITTIPNENVCTVIWDTTKMTSEDFNSQNFIDNSNKVYNELIFDELYNVLTSQGKICTRK